MTQVTIRTAAPEDAPRIHEIEEMCFQDPWSREAIAFEMGENPLALYVVAEADGEFAGYAGLWQIGEEGHITNVAVRPDLQGKGIATQLVSGLIEEGENRGIEDFTLEVRRGNDAGRALYEKFGFRVEGVRKGYYQKEKEDALIMWRRGEDNDRR